MQREVQWMLHTSACHKCISERWVGLGEAISSKLKILFGTRPKQPGVR